VKALTKKKKKEKKMGHDVCVSNLYQMMFDWVTDFNFKRVAEEMWVK